MGGNLRLPDIGARDGQVRTVLERYSRGSITLLRAAELAGVSIYEMIAILEERGIRYRYDISDLEDYVKRRLDKHRLERFRES